MTKIGRPIATHCAKGHIFDEANTRYIARGKFAGERRCATCLEIYKTKRREEKKTLDKKKAARKRDSWFF